jgi:hypothetical protein
MKRLIILLVVLTTSLGFSQGKVRLQNDSLHLLYFDPDPLNLLPADQGLAGSALPSNGTGSFALGVKINLDLWVGTSSSSLSKLGTASITSGALPGTVIGTNITMQTGGNFYFQLEAYDATGGTSYHGESAIFTCNANTGVAYYNITQLTTPASSTWAIGSYDLSSQAAGDRGAIMITLAPEPSGFGLLALGAAGAVLFCRRKAQPQATRLLTAASSC